MSPSRADAYGRYEVKRWYEIVVLSPKVVLDLTDLDPRIAGEVVHLRALIGNNPPWRTKGQLAA